MGDVKHEIQAQMDKMAEAMTNKRFDEITSFYTDDCKVLPAGAEMIIGKEALKTFMNIMSQMADKMGKMESELVDVFSMGATATTVSSGTVYGKDGNVMDKTKAMTFWKKLDDGKWHIHRVCWNHDKACTPAQC